MFWAGLALCLIFWVITPLNSSLLTTQDVTRDIETSFKPFKKLIPFNKQEAAMSPSFLYTSYGVTWLGEKIPSFMTKELIAIPFNTANPGEDKGRLTRGKESWTAQTRVYQTELACTPPEITASMGTQYTFSTDKCTYTVDPISNTNGTRNMTYIGFTIPQDLVSYEVLNERCCNDPNLFFAIWAKSRNADNRSDELDLNALYCKPNYHYQTHEVTVDAADGSILKTSPVGERTNFTQRDGIINITIFESSVGSASTDLGSNPKYFLYQGPDPTLRFKDWGLVEPTRQIPYVIGLSPGKKFDDFKDPMTFRKGLENMHQLLFNTALETLLVPDPGGEEVVGERAVRSIGIVVVPQIAHILTGFLGLVVVCLGGVFLSSHNRQNNLASDPDSLGAKMALVAHSETLLRDFNGVDECPAPHLCMEASKYKLSTWKGEGGYRLDAVDGRDNPLVQSPHASCTVPHDGKFVGPIELSIWTGIVATFVNMALLTLLIVLYKSALRWNGETLSTHPRLLDITVLTCSLGLPILPTHSSSPKSSSLSSQQSSLHL